MGLQHAFGGPLLFIHTLSEAIWAAYLAVICIYALWRGGRPERTAAIAFILAWVATNLLEDRQNWLDPQWGILVVDGLLLATLLWLALTADRSWTLWSAAFQLLGVVTHGAMMADRSVGSWAYITGDIIFSYLVVAALAVGTWLHGRASTA